MHRTEGALAPEVWVLTTSADEFHVLIDLSHAFPRIVNKIECELFSSGDFVACFELAVLNAHISLVAHVATILRIASSSHLLLFSRCILLWWKDLCYINLQNDRF